MKHVLFFLIGTGLFLFTVRMAWGSENPAAQWTDHTLVLNNGAIARKVIYDVKQHSIRTTELKLQGDEHNYSGPTSDEFSFEVDGKVCRGGSGWEFKQFEPVDDARGGKGAALVLRSIAPNPASLELKIVYLLYPKSPVIGKRLVLRNVSDAEVKVESLDVERLQLTLDINNPVYANYARRPHVGPYIGDCYDAVMAVHDDGQGIGVVLGNESPSVLKRTTTFLDGSHISIGLTHKEPNLSLPEVVEAGRTLGEHVGVCLPLSQLPPT